MVELNKLYCMDNLELLRTILDKSIDLIYGDILYNTGKKFKDFDDDLGTPQEAIEWYKPRLKEMHRVLKDTGSIYLHCDFRLSHYIKVLMDKIFGLSNFRNDIVWRYAVNYKAETYPRDNDNILYYTKSEDCTYKQQYRKSKKMKKRLKNVVHQENGKLYYYQGRNLKGSPYIRKLRNKDFVTSNNLEEYFTKREYIGVRVSNVWDDIGFVARGSESVGYDTQKPTRLLERIIKSSSNKGDVVADFFMGSETTIEVAKELGRNYIGCDINPRSVELTQKRLEKLKANSNT